MAMVDVDGSSLLVDSAQIDWLDLRVGGYLAPSLHSSSEPAMAHSHDDSTINISIEATSITQLNYEQQRTGI